jgi:SAM-dependent methyltransferase
MDEEVLRNRLTHYHFYHIIKLAEKLHTPGWSEPQVLQAQEAALRALRSLDLRGKRVLDIGCRDGLFSFEAERLGASEVIGIDNDLSRGAIELLIPHFNSKVRMQELNLYDLTPATFGLFDVVVCPGVLYHLRYPFWGLKLVRDVINENGYLVLETAILVDENEHAVLFCPVGKDSPYEPTSCTFYNQKGLIDSLSSLGLRVQGISRLRKERVGPRRHWLHFRKGLKAFLGLKTGLVIDRMTFVCQKIAQEVEPKNRKVDQYWHGTHRTHSNAEYWW